MANRLVCVNNDIRMNTTLAEHIENISGFILTWLLLGPLIFAAFVVALPMGIAMVFTLLLFSLKK